MQDKIKVIVTSAGTASAISVIRALKSQQEIPAHTIAVDTDPLAAGLYLADEYEIAPPAADPNYLSTLINIAKTKGAEVLIPIYSKEIQRIAAEAAYLRENGLKTFLPSPETISICNDKRRMYSVAAESGVRIPTAYSLDEIERGNVPFPVFVKPNSGSSSTGAEKVDNPRRVADLMSGGKDLVIQEVLSGSEVTVDVFCDAASKPLVIAPRLRLSTKSGQSVKGKTIPNGPYVRPVEILAAELKIRGACNFQFFLREGELVFNEINPRFAAGGLMLTIQSGANIPLLVLKSIIGAPIRPAECIAKPDFVMTRYWQEIIFEEHTR